MLMLIVSSRVMPCVYTSYLICGIIHLSLPAYVVCTVSSQDARPSDILHYYRGKAFVSIGIDSGEALEADVVAEVVA